MHESYRKYPKNKKAGIQLPLWLTSHHLSVSRFSVLDDNFTLDSVAMWLNKWQGEEHIK